MILIQPILIAGFALALLVYLRYFRTSLRDRLLVILLFIAGCVVVIDPDLTQRAAEMVGVGRGTDLTFYVFAMGFVFFVVLSYSRASRQYRAITETVRRVAILEAELLARTGTAPAAQQQPGETRD